MALTNRVRFHLQIGLYVPKTSKLLPIRVL